MPEFQPGAHFNNDKPNEGKRSFLRRVFVGAAAIAVGDKYLVSKDTKKSEEVNSEKLDQSIESANDLFNHFEGKERDYNFAVEATSILAKEMGDRITTVRLSGTGHPNEKIEILRNYLSSHLNSKGIGDKYSSQKQIFAAGVFTKDNLQALHQEAKALAHKHDKAQNPL